MARDQAARTLQERAGLTKKRKLSEANSLRLAMSIRQQNAMAEAALRAPSYAINAKADQRMLGALANIYGSQAQQGAANINPTRQLFKKANITQKRLNEKALKRAKGLEGRLRSGRGRPEEGPGSPGWTPFDGVGDAEGGLPSSTDVMGSEQDIMDAFDIGIGDMGTGEPEAGAMGYDWD